MENPMSQLLISFTLHVPKNNSYLSNAHEYFIKIFPALFLAISSSLNKNTCDPLSLFSICVSPRIVRHSKEPEIRPLLSSDDGFLKLNQLNQLYTDIF